MKKVFLCGLLVLFAFFLQKTAGNAQSIPTGTITINPAHVDLTLSPGQQSLKYDIKITNTTSAKVNLNATAVDLRGLDETGGLLFAGSGGEDFIKKYGIANWISVEPGTISIEPNQSYIVKITIKNQDDLSPGGHYGSILFKTAAVDATQANSQVSLNPSLSSTIFLSKLGGERYDLALKQISVQRNFWNLPNKALITFYNPGNTHNTPRGIVKLLDPTGKTISEGIINQESVTLLPQMERKYQVELKQLKSAFIPGKYKLQVTYHYDGFEQTVTKEISFVYINIVVLIILVIMVLALVVLIKKFLPKIIKKFNGSK